MSSGMPGRQPAPEPVTPGFGSPITVIPQSLPIPTADRPMAVTASAESLENSESAGPGDGKLRIAVVTPIPTPYRDPFWNILARMPGIDLTVYYCSQGKADRPWDVDWQHRYRAQVLPGQNLMAWRGPDA